MHLTLADLVKDAKTRIREITAEQLHGALENKQEQIIVDVREPALAADVLQKMAFVDVESLAGGITNWRNAGYRLEHD